VIGDRPRRFHALGGQIVEVDCYAYIWRGDRELAVGDAVVLPDSWLRRTRVAHVTA
jgi:hypothetical protein